MQCPLRLSAATGQGGGGVHTSQEKDAASADMRTRCHMTPPLEEDKEEEAAHLT